LLCLNFRHAPSDASKAGESKITLSQSGPGSSPFFAKAWGLEMLTSVRNHHQ
jgi:hypothetical protein